jgi:hypothetical protein
MKLSGNAAHKSRFVNYNRKATGLIKGLYTLLQSVRAGIVTDYRMYRHTIVNVEMERAIKRAAELHAFMEDVPYARYEKHRKRKDSF